MLTLLRVRDFAIIDSLEVEFGAGLNVVTGETGAGKSILVDALALVLGGRASPEVVRTGKSEAEIEALFDLDKAPAAKAALEAAGIATDEGLVVRRVLSAGGRARAYLNGRLATVAQLAEVTAGLVDISSQHEHHSLVDPATHLGYLDAFAGVGLLREEMREAYRTLSQASSDLVAHEASVAERAQREDLLRFQLNEIEEVDPQSGEEELLHVERGRLKHAEKLTHAASSAERELYSGDETVCERLARLVAELLAAGTIDETLTPLAHRIEGARLELEEAGRELERYGRGVKSDPQRHQEVMERLDRLGRLKKKHGGALDAVLEFRERARRELDALENHEARSVELTQLRDKAHESVKVLARQLSEKRKRAAKKLGDAISKEVSSLGMGDAMVRVEVAPLEGRRGELEVDGSRLSASGMDRAEFLIAPNRGEDARPLRKIASGGELSRAMLAIKRVLGALGPGGLYVFDEVDSGIGGGVAETIGLKLRDVAEHNQVICVTHLPQISVYADRHYRVRKEVADGRTRSAIDVLTDTERLEEVARMLGGLKITAATREAAGDMMREASRAAKSALCEVSIGPSPLCPSPVVGVAKNAPQKAPRSTVKKDTRAARAAA